MSIDIKESFEVSAPVDSVWRFLMDPSQVVTCMPGAALDEVLDERTFLGTVKVKVGAITTRYKGRVEFTQVDPASHAIQMRAEGRETGGGTAKATITSRLRSLEGGGTEIVTEASADLTGRVMQVGRGMIQGVSHQLFLQFVASAKQRLEAPADPDAASADSSPAPAEGEAIRIVPIVWRTIWSAISGFFRRLFGRSDS